MSTQVTTDAERISFLETLEKEYPNTKEILSRLYSDLDRVLKKRDHKGLIDLIQYTEGRYFQTTAETRFLFLIIQSLSDEMLSNSEMFFVDSYEDHISLFEAYRKITLLIRRLELFDRSEDYYEEAVRELSSMSLTPYIIRIILKNELFDRPDILAQRVFEQVWNSKDIPSRLRYALSFISEYDDNYWKLCCADIFMSVSEYKSALDYLKMLKNPSFEEKELIKSLEALVHE